MPFDNSVPVIGTADVTGTVRYFEQTLGFQKQWAWGEPPVYASVKAGGAIVYISDDSEMAGAIRDRGLKPDVYFWVTDIETVYSQHRANGAEITEDLAERSWGVRQYTVREPNGYLLKIAESD
jgi:uncharacterized glyoxalase superfamily protein PhnB